MLDFKAEILTAHNKYREAHHAPPLKWSDEAAAKAQSWAEKLAKSKSLEHGDHHGMGQNIANLMSSSGSCDMTGQQATDMWYNEVKDYNFKKPGFTSGSGHFTQVVWKSSTHVGAGKASNGGYCVVVANYSPPGNMNTKEQFEKNVLKK